MATSAIDKLPEKIANMADSKSPMAEKAIMNRIRNRILFSVLKAKIRLPNGAGISGMIVHRASKARLIM